MFLVKVVAENIDMELPITLEEFSSYTINTFSRGYHEYMSIWMPQNGGGSLFCRKKVSNEYDECTVAIVSIDHFKREEVIGNVPLFLSKTLSKSFFACPDLVRVAKLQEHE